MDAPLKPRVGAGYTPAGLGGRSRGTHAHDRKRKLLDLGPYRPLHTVGRCPGYPRRIGIHSSPSPGPERVLLFRLTRTDTHRPERSIPITINEGPLPSMGGG